MIAWYQTDCAIPIARLWGEDETWEALIMLKECQILGREGGCTYFTHIL